MYTREMILVTLISSCQLPEIFQRGSFKKFLKTLPLILHLNREK